MSGLTFMSRIVEPSLILEYTFVPCLSYCRFQPSTLSASRRKCSKSSAFAARTSPSCIEKSKIAHKALSSFDQVSITYRTEGIFTELREDEFESGINFKDGCQNWLKITQSCTLLASSRLIQNVTRNTECVIRWRNAVQHVNQWEEGSWAAG